MPETFKDQAMLVGAVFVAVFIVTLIGLAS